MATRQPPNMIGVPQPQERSLIDTRHGIAQAIPSAEAARPVSFPSMQNFVASRLLAQSLGDASQALGEVENINDRIQYNRAVSELSATAETIARQLQQDEKTANNPAVWQQTFLDRIQTAREQIETNFDGSFYTPSGKTAAFEALRAARDKMSQDIGVMAASKIENMQRDQINAMIDIAVGNGDFDTARGLADTKYLTPADRMRVNFKIDQQQRNNHIQASANANPFGVLDQLAGQSLTLNGMELTVGEKIQAENLARGFINDRQNAYQQNLVNQYALTGNLPDNDQMRQAVETGNMSARDYLNWLKQKSSISPVMSTIDFARNYRTIESMLPEIRRMTESERNIAAANTRQQMIDQGATANQASYFERLILNADNIESSDITAFSSYISRLYKAPETRQTDISYVSPQRAQELALEGYKTSGEIERRDAEGKLVIVRKVWREQPDPAGVTLNADFQARAQTRLLELYAQLGNPSTPSDRLNLYKRAVYETATELGIEKNLLSEDFRVGPESQALKTLRSDSVIKNTSDTVTYNSHIDKNQCVINGVPEGHLSFAMDISGNGIVVRNISQEDGGTPDRAALSSQVAPYMNGKPEVITPIAQDIFAKPPDDDPRILDIEAQRRVEEYAATRTSITQRNKQAMAQALMYYWTGKQHQPFQSDSDELRANMFDTLMNAL